MAVPFLRYRIFLCEEYPILEEMLCEDVQLAEKNMSVGHRWCVKGLQIHFIFWKIGEVAYATFYKTLDMMERRDGDLTGFNS